MGEKKTKRTRALEMGYYLQHNSFTYYYQFVYKYEAFVLKATFEKYSGDNS